jgi:hypothetical protein
MTCESECVAADVRDRKRDCECLVAANDLCLRMTCESE